MSFLRTLALMIQARFQGVDPSAPAAVEPDEAEAVSPIILLSPPRTGSTLVYQYLIDAFGLAFVSNIMALVPRYMVRVQRLTRRSPTCRRTTLHPGHYGFIPGLCAPSEAGKVLDHWLRPDADPRLLQDVRCMMVALERQWGAAVVLKAPSLTLQVPRLRTLFPNARLVLLSRDPAFVAQSLYVARATKALPDDQWRGVEPPGYHLAGQDGLMHQVVWQVQAFQRILEGVPCTATLSYERFCDSPKAVITALGQRCGLTPGPSLARLPDRFDPANRVRVDTGTWAAIIRACEEAGLARPPDRAQPPVPPP